MACVKHKSDIKVIALKQKTKQNKQKNKKAIENNKKKFFSTNQIL